MTTVRRKLRYRHDLGKTQKGPKGSYEVDNQASESNWREKPLGADWKMDHAATWTTATIIATGILSERFTKSLLDDACQNNSSFRPSKFDNFDYNVQELRVWSVCKWNY